MRWLVQRPLWPLAVLVIAACSSQGGYESLQASQRFECHKLPPSQQAECERRASEPSYQEYKRQRGALQQAD